MKLKKNVLNKHLPQVLSNFRSTGCNKKRKQQIYVTTNNAYIWIKSIKKIT